MKTFKKIVRHACLILLIVLASVGIGIAGGVPITPNQRRSETAGTAIELVESKEDDAKDELTQSVIKE